MKVYREKGAVRIRKRGILVLVAILLMVFILVSGCNEATRKEIPINLRTTLQNEVASNSDSDDLYLNDKYYCVNDNDCYGSTKGDLFDGKICDVTECINEYLAHGKSQCNYYDSLNYPLKGGRCECVDNKCKANKLVNFIEVAKKHCRKSGLGSCDECNFEIPQGWGTSLRDWKAKGFNCELKPSPVEGLRAYKYDQCDCDESNCVESKMQIYYFLYNEIIAEMAIDKESGEILSKCYLEVE